MKILFSPDIIGWAIGGLVNAKVRNNPQHQCSIIPVHPRDAVSKAADFLRQVKEINPDIIVYEYFRSAEQLIHAEPELKNYTSILVHHNQRDKALFYADWNELGIDTIVTHTNKCREKLNAKGYLNVETINHGIDLDFFTYNSEEPKEKMIGYVGRVVPWKGLKEIAEVAEELGYPVQMMGKPDKIDYWATVPKDNLRFDFLDCKNEERVDAYRNMTIYVGNSEDSYEEGTLPFLEAMACGVPIVTTLNGVANDIIKDEKNALVVPFKNKEILKKQIKRLMEDSDLRENLRKEAWNTVKIMTEQKMALEYSRLFWKVKYPKNDLVSVIIPATYNRRQQVKDILDSLNNQTYSPIEVIVVWDEKENNEEELLKNIFPNLTVREIITHKDGYNLSMARNLGAIEAEGKFLMFNDSRLLPESSAVQSFMFAMREVESDKFWLFGDKGANKKSFVENFSFIKRSDFMKFGMMNERIDEYGGLSQEIRTRWVMQGGQLSYLPSAKATQLLSSGMTEKKRNGLIRMKFRLWKIYNGEAH